MKVLLIYPPAHHMIHTNVPSVVDDEVGHYPPLGLLYVASHLRTRSSHTVEILDTQVLGLTHAQVEDEIRRRRPDVVGIQVMTFTLIDARMVADAAKRVDPRIHVTMGGPHCGIYPEETLRIPSVDTVVYREGEKPFTDLVNALAEGRPLLGIPSIGFRDKDGAVVLGPNGGFVDDLDALPSPARDLVPQDLYDSVLAVRSPVTTMMTSRGCPFQCTYCDRPQMGKRFRYRSARSVVDEMEGCVRSGIGEIFVYDDTFTVNRRRCVEICGEIVRRGLDVTWDVRTRVDMVDEELLRLMRAAGCKRIHFGIESGTVKVLRVFQKEIDLAAAVRTVRLCRRLGIQTLGYFMIGAPTETEADVWETMRFARRLDADFVHIAATTPFPATEIYQEGLRTGFYEKDYWREFAADPTPDFEPRVWEEVMTKEEIWDLLDRCYKYFYRRPTYLTRRLLQVRSAGELKRKVRAGLRILLPSIRPAPRKGILGPAPAPVAPAAVA